MELLSRLTFDAVAASLINVGNMLSDWMQNDPNGPFASKLLFTQQSLVSADNYGLDFRLRHHPGRQPAADQTWRNTPYARGHRHEHQTPRPSNFPSYKTPRCVRARSLEITFNWVRSVTETLPLSVDIASISERYSNPGVVPQYLLHLASIAGNPIHPLELTYTSVSQLALNLDLIAAKERRPPSSESDHQESGHGQSFRTRFILSCDGLNGNLQAGANYSR